MRAGSKLKLILALIAIAVVVLPTVGAVAYAALAQYTSTETGLTLAALKTLYTVNPPGSQRGLPPSPDEGGMLSATLITGDQVYAVKTPNGTWAVFVKPASGRGMFRVLVSGDDVYVIPAGVDLRKFSLDLFNVRLLDEYRRLGVKEIPIIVKLRSIPGETIEQTARRLLPQLTSLPHKTLHLIDAVAVRVPPDKAASVYRELASSPIVMAVTLDHIVRAAEASAAPALYRSVPYIGVPTLWNLGVNGTGIRIAILDTGIDPSHPDFYIGNQSKVIATASFVDYDFDGQPDEPVQDLHGHGTHCAGIAAGTGKYMSVIKGVAPGALILAGKVLSNMGYGYDSWIINGIEWAINNSANIISMSLGGLAYHGYDPLADAVNRAYERGVVVVVAAGNEGPGLFTVASPGVAEGAITVGAYDVDYEEIAGFSSRGPTVNLTVKPDVVAPGVDILSARAADTYMSEPGTLYHVYASGTSMATPHVAGYAALVLQLLNGTGILQAAAAALGVPASHIVKDVIVSTATGYDQASPLVYGMGIINATNLADLVENGLLVIVEPARTDIVVEENTVYNVTLKLFNPFNTTRVLRVEPLLLLFPGASAADTGNAVTVPETVEVQANGTATLTVSIDASKLPVGVHAVKLFFEDNETGRIVAKAMIGVGKPAIAVVNVYYNGTPVYACAEIQALDLASGAGVGSTNVYGGFYGWPTCATGTLVVGPLLPNKAYLLHVYYSDIFAGIGADYYVPIIVPSDYKGMVVLNTSVDLAELPKVTMVVPPGNYEAILEAYYDAVMNVTIGGTSYTLDIPASQLTFNISSVKLEYHIGVVEEASAGSITARVETGVFSVKSTLIPLVANPSRAYVFYREYSEVPFGETIVAKPSVVADTLLHIHSTIGGLAEDYAGLALFCGKQTITVVPVFATTTGSLTAYLIDSPVECSGIALDDVYTGGLSISAASWWEYDYNGYRAYAPLAFPARMTTLWNYMFAYQGLDGYNFSGAYFAGHIFRTWLTGDLSISSGYNYPLMYVIVAPNEKQARAYGYWDSISGVELYWIADNTTPPSLYVGMLLNTTQLAASGIAFANETTVFEARTVANGSYVPGVVVYEFGYGVGGRDIIPLAGYDPLLNMVPQGSNLVLLVLFNEPIWAPVYLDTSSVEIELVNGDTVIPGQVLSWDRLGGIPLPYAIVAFPTADAPAGAYTLRVSAQYYDDETGSTTTISYTVDPAVYIGVPAGQLSAPAAYNVSLAVTATSITGQVLTELKPGTLARLNIDYSLVGFTEGSAKLVVKLVKDDATVSSMSIALEPGSQGSVDLLVLVPWEQGAYKIKVCLVLDDTIALMQVIPS